MAAETIDEAIKDYGIKAGKSKTEDVPLVGSDYYTKSFYIHMIQDFKLPEHVGC
jgi:glycerol-3-phosphate dehydrogenase